MIRGRSVLLAVCLLTALGLVAGTEGVSSTAAERGIHLRVADDDSAYVGVEQTVTRGNNQTTLTVTVQNQFPSGETLDTVTVTVEQETRDLGTLHSGDAESARFVDVDCEGPVLIEASGDSVSAQLDREECTNLES